MPGPPTKKPDQHLRCGSCGQRGIQSLQNQPQYANAPLSAPKRTCWHEKGTCGAMVLLSAGPDEAATPGELNDDFGRVLRSQRFSVAENSVANAAVFQLTKRHIRMLMLPLIRFGFHRISIAAKCMMCIPYSSAQIAGNSGKSDDYRSDSGCCAIKSAEDLNSAAQHEGRLQT